MRRSIVVYTSDMSGEPGAIPHTITLDGVDYEIDLTPDEWKRISTPIRTMGRRLSGGSVARAGAYSTEEPVLEV